MNNSSTQVPFVLAAFIAVLINSFFAEPEQTVQVLGGVTSDAQHVSTSMSPTNQVESVIKP